MADAFARLQRALAKRYTVQRAVGSGGMATVYLAEDVKHHSLVAFKSLRHELATAERGMFSPIEGRWEGWAAGVGSQVPSAVDGSGCARGL